LKRKPDDAQFQPGKLGVRERPPALDRYVPPPLTGLLRFLPSAKRTHAETAALAVGRYEVDVEKHAVR
jgi:hypothetical protein